LQKIINEIKQRLAELQGNNAYNDNFNLEIKQEEVISTSDVFISPSNMVIDFHQNENEINAQVEPSARTLIFDTKDLFPTKAQT
jgi:hypothetical protein